MDHVSLEVDGAVDEFPSSLLISLISGGHLSFVIIFYLCPFRNMAICI